MPARPVFFVPKSHPDEYEWRYYPGDLAVFMRLKRNSKMPQALQDNDLKSCFFLMAFLRSVFIPEEHQANLLFAVEEVKVL